MPAVVVTLALVRLYLHQSRSPLHFLPNRPMGRALPCAPRSAPFGRGLPGFVPGRWREYLPLIADLPPALALSELAAILVGRLALPLLFPTRWLAHVAHFVSVIQPRCCQQGQDDYFRTQRPLCNAIGQRKHQRGQRRQHCQQIKRVVRRSTPPSSINTAVTEGSWLVFPFFVLCPHNRLRGSRCSVCQPSPGMPCVSCCV